MPFFNLAEEIKDTSKAYIVPRENPRSVFTASAEMSHVSTSKEEAYSLNHARAVEYEDGKSLINLVVLLGACSIKYIGSCYNIDEEGQIMNA